MAIIIKKKIQVKNRCWQRSGEIIASINYYRMKKWFDQFRRKVWQFLKRLNIDFPYDLEIPLLGKYPRKVRTYVHTKL